MTSTPAQLGYMLEGIDWRRKFSCRICEMITQPPLPNHRIARGGAGPGLLAHVLFNKYGLHLRLHRQSQTYACEGRRPDPHGMAVELRAR